MARICNQSLLAQLPASFSWKRSWGDPDLEGILEVRMIDMLYPSEGSCLRNKFFPRSRFSPFVLNDPAAHSAKPKLFALGDAKASSKWKRMRLSLRGTDLQFRDPDVRCYGFVDASLIAVLAAIRATGDACTRTRIRR